MSKKVRTNLPQSKEFIKSPLGNLGTARSNVRYNKEIIFKSPLEDIGTARSNVNCNMEIIIKSPLGDLGAAKSSGW